MSQPCQQTYIIHLAQNMASYYNIIRETFFFKNHAENKSGRLVPDLFLFFQKALFEVKASGLQLSFKIFR